MIVWIDRVRSLANQIAKVAASAALNPIVEVTSDIPA